MVYIILLLMLSCENLFDNNVNENAIYRNNNAKDGVPYKIIKYNPPISGIHYKAFKAYEDNIHDMVNYLNLDVNDYTDGILYSKLHALDLEKNATVVNNLNNNYQNLPIEKLAPANEILKYFNDIYKYAIRINIQKHIKVIDLDTNLVTAKVIVKSNIVYKKNLIKDVKTLEFDLKYQNASDRINNELNNFLKKMENATSVSELNSLIQDVNVSFSIYSSYLKTNIPDMSFLKGIIDNFLTRIL